MRSRRIAGPREGSGSVGGIATTDAKDVRFVPVVVQLEDYPVIADPDAERLGGDVDEAPDVRVAGFGETVERALNPACVNGIESQEVLFGARRPDQAPGHRPSLRSTRS